MRDAHCIHPQDCGRLTLIKVLWRCVVRIALAVVSFAILLSMPLDSFADSERNTDSKAAGRAVTHEDLWLMRRLGTPAPSPNGQWVIVAVSEPSYEEDADVSDLWLLAADGSGLPRRLTASMGPEAGVTWSSDSGRIAFAAKRGDDDVNQIYVLSMTMPGEALKVTTLATGASNPKWSPDGRSLAFESRVFPGASNNEENAAEKKRRDELGYNVSAYETFPIRQWDRWRDDLQTHLFVQVAKSGAIATDLLAGSELVAGPGFAGIPSLAGDSLAAEWTPDGDALIFSATRNNHEAAFRESDFQIYHVSTKGGEPQQLTRGSNWSCHSGRFNPAGSALYCMIEPRNEFAYNPTDIARFDWPANGAVAEFSANPDVLTHNFDRSVSGITFGSDGRSVYLTTMDAGRVRLFRLRARVGDITPVNEESGGVYAGVQAAGRSLVARWEDASHPAEIVRINPRTGQHNAITSFNRKRAAELDRPAFREFWFESSSGRRIHSFVALPPAFDENKQYPVITLIHGGPHSSSVDADHIRWSPHVLAAPGYVVVMTDYTGSVGYGTDFSQSIQSDPLKTPGIELLEALDEAIRLYPFIDADRQAAVGASYGGHLVNWLQGTTKRFKTLIGHAGLIDLEGQWSSSDVVYHREINNGGPPWEQGGVWREQSPSTYANNFSTPMMLTIGEKDYRVPINQTISAWTYLNRKNVPGRLLVFHDANHWIMKGAEARYYWNEVHAWLARYLQPTTTDPQSEPVDELSDPDPQNESTVDVVKDELAETGNEVSDEALDAEAALEKAPELTPDSVKD